LQVLEFLNPMAHYTGAADVVVCRGSANTLAELGVQGKAAVVVPSPFLANGHQVHNADILAKHQSAVVVTQELLYDEQQGLGAAVRRLLDDSRLRHELGKRLHVQYPAHAAERVAKLLVDSARRKEHS
jgi:UDP-N-acetylglucosamine--N-acetylmuramyl-(pentapeptide) pyrophosphoryl-undecaprenol N-acetylglucosamine transferase